MPVNNFTLYALINPTVELASDFPLFIKEKFKFCIGRGGEPVYTEYTVLTWQRPGALEHLPFPQISGRLSPTLRWDPKFNISVKFHINY